MRKSILATIITISFFFAALADKQLNADESQPSASNSEADSGIRLPVRRVVLYKNGMGYFEHSTHIRGNQDLAIDFTTSQLNDVLKSLTAVDLGEGRISGVRYNSIAPLDERLKALRLPFGEQLTRIDFLAALRGARVEVHNGSEAATGRLLSVEKEKRFNEKGDSYEVTEFSVMTDGGDMRNFDLGPSTSVRLAERDLSDEVEKYLNLIGSSRARDLRRMTISATGTGEREIFVSYISEVPVWKSTYRIILPEKPNEKPVLQGWAIVDNTVGEDWKDVQLSLIAGAPQSFIQDISRPLYTRRPVVPLPQAAMLTPQTQEASMSTAVTSGRAGDSKRHERPNLTDRDGHRTRSSPQVLAAAHSLQEARSMAATGSTPLPPRLNNKPKPNPKTWETISNTTSNKKSRLARISRPWCRFCNLPSRPRRLPSGTRTHAKFAVPSGSPTAAA